MDGDLAPLRELLSVAKRYGLLTYLDDAHGSGVLGASGAGSASHAGVHGEFDLALCTYSKAYASQGAAVCGSALLVDWLVNKSRGFIFSTALPPHVAAVSFAALRVSQEEEWRRTSLSALSVRLRSRLRVAGLDVPDGITPIVPVIIGGAEETVRASRKLWDEGIYIPAIRPPTVKEGTSRLRVSLMSTHTEADVDFAAGAILRATGRA
jgi:8-amino-7-oxononanoate synthase